MGRGRLGAFVSIITVRMVLSPRLSTAMMSGFTDVFDIGNNFENS